MIVLPMLAPNEMMVIPSETDPRMVICGVTVKMPFWRLYGTTPGMVRKLTSTVSITVDCGRKASKT